MSNSLLLKGPIQKDQILTITKQRSHPCKPRTINRFRA